ncbi:branched chain amino acid aminotransferase, partial [Klebsiella pneumoniae]
TREPQKQAEEDIKSGTAAENTPERSEDGNQVGAGRRGPETKRKQEAF